MKILIGDCEGNGLKESVSKIWTAVFRELNTKNYYYYDYYNKDPEDITKEILVDYYLESDSEEDIEPYQDIPKDLREFITKFNNTKKIEEKDLENFLMSYDKIVIHNFIDYDRIAFKKVFGFNLPLEKCWDSLLFSKMLHPDIKAPITMLKKTKPHSLEAYGNRVGIKKYPDLDWTKYSTLMHQRCLTDVDINHKMFNNYIYSNLKNEIS
jgi:hypothetical protein